MSIYPPLGLIQIASALKRAGADVTLITFPTVQEPFLKIRKACENALFVGISIMTPEVPNAIEVARAIRSEYDIPIIWGGWHATLFPEQMAKSDLVDRVIVDEGDDAIVDIFEDLKRGEGKFGDNCEKIVRSDKKINQDCLPIPDYSLVPNLEKYINARLTDKFLQYDKRSIRWLPYQASRGCPGKCAFCINVVTNNRMWRKKNSHKVVDEIEAIVNKYNLNHIKIVDDNFFVNTNWVQQIAERLISKSLDITWDAECRADYIIGNKVDDNILDLCVRSGLNELNFGLESGSASTLSRMRKGVTPEQNFYAVKKASNHGIVCRCSFIIDIPGDTKKDIVETIGLINKIRSLPKTTCGVHTYRPYPKSELCENLLERNVIKQPDTFEEWADEEHVAQFTYCDAKREWQDNYHFSQKVSFYQNLESGFWIKPHQINNPIARAINTSFMKLAKWRNRHFFFSLNADIQAYKTLRDYYLKHF